MTVRPASMECVGELLMTLYTTGYGRWPAKQRLERLVRALKKASITTLIDIRHSPCPSNVDPASNYPAGPRCR